MLYVVIIILSVFIFIFIRNRYFYFLSHPWKARNFSCEIEELISFSRRHSYFSKHPLVGKVSSSLADFEITTKLLKVVDKNILDPQERILASSEILCKVLAYRDLKEGMVFHLPTVERSGKANSSEYVVDRLFNLWKGMPAFGLISKDGKSPILLFRGTDLSLKTERGRASLLSDIDIAGPGLHTFLRARESINSWLSHVYKRCGMKARVFGFSLGGTLATYTALFEYRLISKDLDQPSIVFNPPGVTKKIYRKWERMKREKRPSLLVFITKNDLIPKIGKVIGDKYRLVPDKIKPPFYAHTTLVVAERKYDMYPVGD